MSTRLLGAKENLHYVELRLLLCGDGEQHRKRSASVGTLGVAIPLGFNPPSRRTSADLFCVMSEKDA